MTIMLATILWAAVTYLYAKRNGLKFYLWAAIGGFFGILGFFSCVGFNLFKNSEFNKKRKII